MAVFFAEGRNGARDHQPDIGARISHEMAQVIGELMFESELAKLSPEVIAKIPRQAELGELNFSAAMPSLQTIRKLVAAYASQPVEELPTSVTDSIGNQLAAVLSCVDQIQSFSLAQPNPTESRANLVDQINQLAQWFLQTVRPQIRGEAADLSVLILDARTKLEEIAQLEAQASSAVDSIRKLAGQAGSGQLSGYYKERATHYEKQAKSYLIASSVVFILTVVLAIFLLAVYPPVHTNAAGSPDWTLLARNSISRLFFLGLASYALAFTIRTNRTNMHLKVANEQKQNALDTYSVIGESISDPNLRNVVTAELVNAVFASTDTGFLPTGEERATGDGGAPAWLSILLSRGPSATQD